MILCKTTSNFVLIVVCSHYSQTILMERKHALSLYLLKLLHQLFEIANVRDLENSLGGFYLCSRRVHEKPVYKFNKEFDYFYDVLCFSKNKLVSQVDYLQMCKITKKYSAIYASTYYTQSPSLAFTTKSEMCFCLFIAISCQWSRHTTFLDIKLYHLIFIIEICCFYYSLNDFVF